RTTNDFETSSVVQDFQAGHLDRRSALKRLFKLGLSAPTAYSAVSILGALAHIRSTAAQGTEIKNHPSTVRRPTITNVPPRPIGIQFYGVFHSPIHGINSVGNMYTAFWDFNNTWKKQIDACKSIGANLLVYFGSFFAGNSDLSLYLSRRRQIVEYLAAKGMYALSYWHATFSQWINSISNEQVCDVLAADNAMMSQYPNVIGCVTVDEPWMSGVGEGGTIADATIVSYIAAQYAAVKAVVPADFPVCAAPNPCGDPSIGGNVFQYVGNEAKCGAVAPYCDFFAFHPFNIPSWGDTYNLRMAYPGKRFMMTSSVLSENGDPNMAAKATAIFDMVDRGVPDIRGMAWFLCTDFDANTYGLFNNDF